MLRVLHGNPSRRPVPVDEPQGQGELWAPPPWFDTEQRAQWDYALEFAPVGLLTATDRECLVIWCVAACEHAKAVQQVRALGQVVKTKDGNAIQNPYLPIVNRQALIMLRAGAEMGFSPAARASLGRDPAGEPTLIGSGRPSRLDEYLASKPDKLDS
jgi:P27 family predicted phage terminase small subunit